MLQMMLALLVSFLIVLLMGPKFIPYMHKLHFGQTIYELGPQHKAKQGTPVMGGLMIAAAVVVCCIAFHPISWGGAWEFMIPLVVFSLLSMAVGFADDYIKAVKKRHEGLTPKQKIIGQVGSALAFSVYCYFNPKVGSSIYIPFTSIEWNLGIFYIPLMTLVIIFMVNSSNLQDGLDGLLSTVTVVSMPGWAAMALIMGLLYPALKQDYMNIAVFALAFAVFASFGAVIPVHAVWTLSDIFNALMAFPNLLALLLLNKKAVVHCKRQPIVRKR